MKIALSAGIACLSLACGRTLFSADGGSEAAGGGMGGTGGGGQVACSTLKREGCQARPDCLTTLCMQCSCTPVFRQCRAVGEAALQCPDLGCAQPQCCGKQSECGGTQSCVPPGTPTGCGACFPGSGSCAIDADCSPSTTGQICDPVHCSCTQALACRDGCTKNSDCTVDGDVCNTSTHRCGPQSCSAASPCVSYFDCVQGSCQRKPCTTQAQCPFGSCVSGGCYGGLGVCQNPVP